MSIIRFEDGYYGQVLIGNTATYLGKQSEPTKTHRWTCYVKGRRAVQWCVRDRKDLFAAQLLARTVALSGVADADIYKWVSSVVFELHSSFAQPRRGSSL